MVASKHLEFQPLIYSMVALLTISYTGIENIRYKFIPDYYVAELKSKQAFLISFRHKSNKTDIGGNLWIRNTKIMKLKYLRLT